MKTSAPERRRQVRQTAVLVFLSALAYFLCFHRYGLYLEDEGVNAYQALRVYQGQVPYADFQTAYTPGSYYLHAALFWLFSPSLAVLRVAASVACATTAALLFLAGVEVLPGLYALLPSVLYVILEDQESRGFVVHTIAYPARYVSMLWAASLWLTLVYARRPRRGLAVALGLVTAGILAFKHTAGIYNAWAVGFCLILVARAEHEPGLAGAPRALAFLPLAFVLVVLAGLSLLFGSFTAAGLPGVLVFGVPVALLTVFLLPCVVPVSVRRRTAVDRAGAALAWLFVAALLPTALWVTYFAHAAGAHALAQRLILDGPAVARSYAIDFPAPGLLVVGAGLLIGIAVVGRVVARRGVGGRAAAAHLLIATGAALLVLAVAPAAIVVRQAIRMQEWELAVMHLGRDLDNLAFYLVPVVAYAFLLPLVRFLCRGGTLDPVILFWVHAVCQLVLSYPRLDTAHLYEGVVILLVPGTALLARSVAYFGTSPALARRLTAGVVFMLFLVAAAKLVPRVHAQVGWGRGGIVRRRQVLDGPRGGLYETTGLQAARIGDVNRLVALVQARVPAETPIFVFPALPGLYFLSERRNPTQLDYFYLGFGEGRDELRAVETLDALRVPLVVLMADYSYDPPDRGFFPILKDYLRRHYVQVELVGPFRVLERAVS